MSILSSVDVVRYMDLGAVVIEPFDERFLGPNSYDLELGPWFAIPKTPDGGVVIADYDPASKSPDDFFSLVNVAEEGGILLAPGQRVLGHTCQRAGGTISPGDTAATSRLHATSTAGRWGLSVCMCAGLGDVGFTGIWTMEICNLNDQGFWLPVGSIISQVVFYSISLPRADYVASGGRYHRDVGQWRPEDMLPGPLKEGSGLWKNFEP